MFQSFEQKNGIIAKAEAMLLDNNASEINKC
jgi:hypothetical protein